MSEHNDPLERLVELVVFAPIGAGVQLAQVAPPAIANAIERGRDVVLPVVQHARGLGQISIAFGVPFVRRRIGEQFAQARRRAEDALGVVPEPVVPEPVVPESVVPEPVVPESVVPEPVVPEPIMSEPVAPVAPAAWSVSAPAPAAASRPEPAAPAVPASGGWSPVARPSRPLTAVPSVAAPRSEELPIPGYDALSASQVVERLMGLAPAELETVHAYEAAHRQRRTILGKIEQLAG